jgi:hypothetical protein
VPNGQRGLDGITLNIPPSPRRDKYSLWLSSVGQACVLRAILPNLSVVPSSLLRDSSYAPCPRSCNSAGDLSWSTAAQHSVKILTLAVYKDAVVGCTPVKRVLHENKLSVLDSQDLPLQIIGWKNPSGLLDSFLANRVTGVSLLLTLASVIINSVPNRVPLLTA